MKKIFSFDAETDGLWGDPFAIAAIVYEERQMPGGKPWFQIIDQIILRLPDAAVKNEWVKENILPALSTETVTHDHYLDMVRDFSTFYMTHKTPETEFVCHMGYIVEAHLLREMRRYGFIGEWDAPYPLYDVSGNLQAFGENPTSVDEYAKKMNLDICDYGSTHNPLYDCEVAAKVYMRLNEKHARP